MDINLQVPIWTIEHVAVALHTSVDTAREHSYGLDFPAPKAAFAKNLWEREAVLDWFAGLPARERRSVKTDKSASKAAHITRQPGLPMSAAATVRNFESNPPQKQAIKPYKPRSAR